MNNFKELNLLPEIQKIIESLGFTEPTEIQAKAIPILLEKDKVDFHGQAQTGTGKTLAFGLPLLHRIDKNSKLTQALIISPTRELAEQIKDSLTPFCKALNISIEAIYGGTSMENQIRKLRNGLQIVVGTPGRINDHLRRKTLNLSNLKTLILDEADIMLDMGFKEEIDEILKFTPATKEIWLFSATVKSGIDDIKRKMQNPIVVSASTKQVGSESVKHYFCTIPNRARLDAILRFIECSQDFYGFIFCQTKNLTAEVAEQLARMGYKAGALHGDMSQASRNVMIKNFKDKEIDVLVATDVAARGIDINNVTHVINFSLPDDLESYIHRSGRTGRAGKDGIAITFLGKNDMYLLRLLQKRFKVDFSNINVPSFDEVVKTKIKQVGNFITETISETSQPKYALELKEIVNNLNQEQMQAALIGLLHTKFLATIPTRDIHQEQQQPTNRDTFRQYGSVDSNNQEIFINLGSDDGVNRDHVVNCLVRVVGITNDEIKKIRVIKRRTFIEIPTTVAQKTLRGLQGKLLCGKKARASFVREATH